jgi:nucleotide-binding universal stress UspA family protein
MSIKDIVVALAPADENDPGRDFALAMASKYGAHVTAAAYAIVPEIPGGASAAVVRGLVRDAKAHVEEQVNEARRRFESAAKSAAVYHHFHGATTSLHVAARAFAQRLRTADIAVMTQSKPKDLEHVGDVFLEAALFGSGRPVIVVPKTFRGQFSVERILIAWDGSLHASRAVLGAMPLMNDAQIQVFSVEETAKGRDFLGSALVEHLRRHQLDAGLAQNNAADIPNAILKEADLFRASLVVMGGYGHSRFREIMFGGATRSMLAEMCCPVLMAH